MKVLLYELRANHRKSAKLPSASMRMAISATVLSLSTMTIAQIKKQGGGGKKYNPTKAIE